MTEIKIHGDYIKLENLLKFQGCVVTGGEAKLVISDGHVKVNGEVCRQRGKKIKEGDKVLFDGEEFTVKNDN